MGYAAHAPATPEETRLARAMPHRHTHRGPFGPEPVPDTLLYELRDHARTEGADLRIIDEPEQLRLLADFVHAAEDVPTRGSAPRRRDLPVRRHGRGARRGMPSPPGRHAARRP
ncbi:hypothetical protein [Streptomyces cyaneochromogenes]|uniref:hypothetical protein n=1 Tax=Streptomyces cyaneochromogenes TaxID=2496836 RepID=UPI00158D7CFF|nr:hypothetical protein [Streptomyces cyaneochromogenes]